MIYVLALGRKCNYNMYMYAFDIFYFIYYTVSLPFLLKSHHVILCSVNVILLIISHFDYITYFAGTNGVILMRLECTRTFVTQLDNLSS